MLLSERSGHLAESGWPQARTTAWGEGPELAGSWVQRTALSHLHLQMLSSRRLFDSFPPGPWTPYPLLYFPHRHIHGQSQGSAVAHGHAGAALVCSSAGAGGAGGSVPQVLWSGPHQRSHCVLEKAGEGPSYHTGHLGKVDPFVITFFPCHRNCHSLNTHQWSGNKDTHTPQISFSIKSLYPKWARWPLWAKAPYLSEVVTKQKWSLSCCTCTVTSTG